MARGTATSGGNGTTGQGNNGGMVPSRVVYRLAGAEEVMVPGVKCRKYWWRWRKTAQPYSITGDTYRRWWRWRRW